MDGAKVETCLILTGHVRSFAQCKDSILEKFCDGGTDIYACTWDDRGDYCISKEFGLPIIKQSILAPLPLPKFVPLAVEGDIFNGGRAAEHMKMGWVERLKRQWYCVKKGFELLDDYLKYEVIVRCRFDLMFTGGVFDSGYDYINILTPNPPNTYNDHCAWGSPDVMQKYCNMFDHIEEMYERYNVDISNAEEMLKFYMEEFVPIVKTRVCDLKYHVMKIENDNTRI